MNKPCSDILLNPKKTAVIKPPMTSQRKAYSEGVPVTLYAMTIQPCLIFHLQLSVENHVQARRLHEGHTGTHHTFFKFMCGGKSACMVSEHKHVYTSNHKSLTRARFAFMSHKTTKQTIWVTVNHGYDTTMFDYQSYCFMLHNTEYNSSQSKTWFYLICQYFLTTV